MSRHQRLAKTMRSQSRQHHRRRHVPADQREQAFKGRQMARSELEAAFGGAPKVKHDTSRPLPATVNHPVPAAKLIWRPGARISLLNKIRRGS